MGLYGMVSCAALSGHIVCGRDVIENKQEPGHIRLSDGHCNESGRATVAKVFVI